MKLSCGCYVMQGFCYIKCECGSTVCDNAAGLVSRHMASHVARCACRKVDPIMNDGIGYTIGTRVTMGAPVA